MSAAVLNAAGGTKLAANDGRFRKPLHSTKTKWDVLERFHVFCLICLLPKLGGSGLDGHLEALRHARCLHGTATRIASGSCITRPASTNSTQQGLSSTANPQACAPDQQDKRLLGIGCTCSNPFLQTAALSPSRRVGSEEERGCRRRKTLSEDQDLRVPGYPTCVRASDVQHFCS